MSLYFSNANQLWLYAASSIHNEGKFQKSRAGDTYEVLGWQGILTNIDHNFLLSKVRKLDPAYACAELLWYLSGGDDVAMMEAYAPSYRKFAEPDSDFCWGAYGPRIMDQLPDLEDILKREPSTRQAVIQIFDEYDLAVAHQKNDIPCTLSLHFLNRDDQLHLLTNMRSNDLWLGMPYDVFCFSTLQRILADKLGLGYGIYVHKVDSLHVYDKNYGQANKTVEELEAYGQSASAFPNLEHGWDKQDPRWDNAIGMEEAWRVDKLIPAYFTEPQPLVDCALTCMKKLEFKFDRKVPMSPVLAKAWEIKYADN